MMNKYIREHITLVSVIIFIVIFGGIQFMKPSCFYNTNGSIREFGVGYKNKTILPVWLLSIVLGISCYLAVLYFVNAPKMR
jgi:hypothetical protein